MAVYLLSVCRVDKNETRHFAPVRPIRSCVRVTLRVVFESGVQSDEAVTPRRTMHCRTHAELLHGVTSFRFWLNKNASDRALLLPNRAHSSQMPEVVLTAARALGRKLL